MNIQFNTDHHIHGSEALKSPLMESIKHGLNRFGEHITKVEVHLKDENGNKSGGNDIRCALEAHLAGLKPIAVTHHGSTHEQAVQGAVDKMKSTLDSTLGRLKNH